MCGVCGRQLHTGDQVRFMVNLLKYIFIKYVQINLEKEDLCGLRGLLIKIEFDKFGMVGEKRWPPSSWHFDKGSFINDVTQYWTIFDLPPAIVTLFITMAFVQSSQNY